MRRAAIGLIVRLVVSTVISLTAWWLFITPFERLPFSPSTAEIVVRVLDFPVALAGELLPIRGMELVFNNYDSWCDFCQPEQAFRLQMRIAIPVYLFLLYVPAILRSFARRDARQFHRVVIAVVIYALFITAYIFAIGGSDGRDDFQLAAKWLLTLLAAAGVAWSNVSGRLKAAAISLVLLLGTWTLPFTRSLIAPKFDEALAYFVSYLVLLSFGVGVTLWLTWVTERGFESWRRGRLDPETS